MSNAAVLEAIDHELRLNARIEQAKSAAISTAVASVVTFATINVPNFGTKQAAEMADFIRDSVNLRFDAVDYVKALETAAAQAAYKKGLPSIRIDAEKVLAESEPELKVLMAEAALKQIGLVTADVLIEMMKRHLKNLRHG